MGKLISKINNFLLKCIIFIIPTGIVKSGSFVKDYLNNIIINCDINKAETLARNFVLKNKHKNNRCFVLGNGPSLKKQDISLLKNEITFVMNAFWKHPVINRDWQPNYYCLADPLFFDGSESMNKFFQSLKKNIKNSIFIVPNNAKKIIEEQKLLPDDRTYYVEFEANRKFENIDLTNQIPSVQSTSQLAIETAIYMGCSPIYLLGLDHDWLAHRGMERHFYQGKTIEDHLIAHGDLSKSRYKDELEACLRLWQKYEKLLDLADKKGINIYNATEGGFLDAFPRVKYKSLFNK